MHARYRRGMRRIVLFYALFGATWIVASGYAVHGAGIWSSVDQLLELSKGLFFIFVTSVLLWGLLERLARQLSRAFEERLEARNRLAAVAESPLMGIAAWSVDGQILEANDTLLAMWGYSRRQFESEKPGLKELSPPEFYENDLACMRNAVESAVAGPFEKIHLCRDGSRLPVITGLTAIKGSSSEGLLFVLDDTERRKATEELSRLLGELEHRVEERTRELQISNEELESFGYSVSHDLRAPLRAIDGMAVLIRQEGAPLSEEQLHAVDRIRHNVARMSMLVDALLQLARTTRAPLKSEEVDLTRVFELALADVRSSYPDSEVKVHIEPGMKMEGDTNLLRVMAHNMLDNGFKFTKHVSGPRIDVTLHDCTLKISDNGVGFDPSLASGLFRPFHRLHMAPEFPGTGIGLAIVQRIVRRHQGTISASAVPGSGAEFSIWLPSASLGTTEGDKSV